MKVTKKDRIRLNGVLDAMQKAQSFLARDDISVCLNGTAFNKQIGSELVYLRTSIQKLSEILQEK
jgi:hypothetical protein